MFSWLRGLLSGQGSGNSAPRCRQRQRRKLELEPHQTNDVKVAEVSATGVVRNTLDLGTPRGIFTEGHAVSIDGNGIYTVVYTFTDLPFPSGDGSNGVLAQRGQL